MSSHDPIAQRAWPILQQMIDNGVTLTLQKTADGYSVQAKYQGGEGDGADATLSGLIEGAAAVIGVARYLTRKLSPETE